MNAYCKNCAKHTEHDHPVQISQNGTRQKFVDVTRLKCKVCKTLKNLRKE